MFTAALFITVKNGNNPNVYKVMNGHTKCVIHKMECYSAIEGINTCYSIDKP